MPNALYRYRKTAEWQELTEGRESFEAGLIKKYEDEAILNTAKTKYAEFIGEQKLVSDPKLDGMKKLALDSIANEIFGGNYVIDKEMNIFNPDGTKAKHPDQDTVLDSVYELLKYRAEKAGLYQVSNGGKGGDGSSVFEAEGKKQANKGAMSDAEKRMLERMQKRRMGT